MNNTKISKRQQALKDKYIHLNNINDNDILLKIALFSCLRDDDVVITSKSSELIKLIFGRPMLNEEMNSLEQWYAKMVVD